MCYAASCNPLCGRCKPRRIVETVCPQCGAPCSMTREEYLVCFGLPHRKGSLERKVAERSGVGEPRCESCGRDLTEVFRRAVDPAPCHLQQVVCGFPCGRRDEPPRDGAPPCRTMVPLGRLAEGGDGGAAAAVRVEGREGGVLPL